MEYSTPIWAGRGFKIGGANSHPLTTTTVDLLLTIKFRSYSRQVQYSYKPCHDRIIELLVFHDTPHVQDSSHSAGR